MGNTMVFFFQRSYITNSVGGEEVKAVLRFELPVHTFFRLVSTGFFGLSVPLK